MNQNLSKMPVVNIIRVILVLCLLSLSSQSRADNSLLLYGTELSPESRYVYLGTIIPVNHNEDNYFVRLWSDMMSYEYKQNTTVIEAKSKNLQIAFGKQFSYDHGWFNTYLGYALNSTSLNPDDTANESRGRHGQAIISIDGEHKLTSCEHGLNYGVSYLLDQGSYWLRVRPICWTYDQNKIGFEMVYHGDKNYNHLQLGGILYNKILSSDTNYTLKAGLTTTQDSDVFPYVGIELTTRY